MNKKTTPSQSTSYNLSLQKVSSIDKPIPCQPSERTLAFLRAFARNYRAETRLPESLQGIILG